MIAAVTPAGVTSVCTGSLLLGAAAALEGVSARANVRAGERAVC
jgi:putative intracellular protease/amidase